MPILKVSPIALNQLWKLEMHLTVEVVFILSINNGFWVPGSSMCSFFLGEHIISFIFMMSLQQIFILDILRLRDMIFYKIPLSLLALALVFPLPFPPLQGLNLQGVFILSQERNWPKCRQLYLIVLFIYCISLLCVKDFCIYNWWCPQRKQVRLQVCIVFLACMHFPKSGSPLDSSFQVSKGYKYAALLLSAKDKSVVRYVTHRKEWYHRREGAGMNHNTLHNMLFLWM